MYAHIFFFLNFNICIHILKTLFHLYINKYQNIFGLTNSLEILVLIYLKKLELILRKFESKSEKNGMTYLE